MRSSRTTSNLILAGTLGFGTLVAMASPAFADTPAQEADEMVLVFAPDDTDPKGPGDLAPAPTPDPEVDDITSPAPQPEPDPTPGADLPIAQPTGHGDPEPEGDLPIANPEPGPDLPDGPDDITSDQGCALTHGCPEDEPTPDGDEPVDSSTGVDVQGSTTDRGALPRTGAGLALLALGGSALTAVGVAVRKLAQR